MSIQNVPVVLELEPYFESLGLAPHEPLSSPCCEVCGSYESDRLRDAVRVTDRLWVRFSVVSCRNCGYLYQLPRFDESYYREYYARLWRSLLFGDSTPTAEYVACQIDRGRLLAGHLSSYLPHHGRLLDVGCGAGGLMRPFIDNGWTAHGIDPDRAAAAYGARELGLSVVEQAAEELSVPEGSFDLIIITGSLEHVFNPNEVLSRCWRAGAPGSLLLLEGHALGQAATYGALGHNHRRLLTGSTMELFMLKHGWTPILTTSRELCGPTRPGSVFVLGRRDAPSPPDRFQSEVLQRRELPSVLSQRLTDLGIR